MSNLDFNPLRSSDQSQKVTINDREVGHPVVQGIESEESGPVGVQNVATQPLRTDSLSSWSAGSVITLERLPTTSSDGNDADEFAVDLVGGLPTTPSCGSTASDAWSTTSLADSLNRDASAAEFTQAIAASVEAEQQGVAHNQTVLALSSDPLLPGSFHSGQRSV